MKYGDTLRQHSVPEWAYYNVDYDAVKHLIKESTSLGKGKAVDIPGQGDDASISSEKRLFASLQTEHERVGLFVKSKSNEIQGRLGDVEKTFRKLQSRNGTLNSEGPRPYLLQRYAKLEQDAINAGEEIRSLSRFIAAQRTAFRKLLKKYKKWSRSTELSQRFQSEVLNRPTSFTRISLHEEFDRWTEALQSIRQATRSGNPSNGSVQSSVPTATSRRSIARKAQENSSAVAFKFEEALSSASDVNFDTTFSETSMGDAGSRAVYWVHPEQLIEIQVLLLQHLRLYITGPPPRSRGSSLPGSPATTRRSSVSVRQDGSIERETDTGTIYIDKVEDYVKRQSRATVNDSEDAIGDTKARPSGAARWTSTMDDATIAFRQSVGTNKLSLTRVRKKYLGALLDAERDFKPWQTSGQTTPLEGSYASLSQDNTSPDEARELLEKRKDVKPLVAVFSKRTRFIGLGNSSSAGQWAMLDAQICISKISTSELAGKDWAANLSRDATSFPYAVLRVREEGNFATDLINVLDKSHLAERVRGFSLANHAIWECWKPRGMVAPFWTPALSKDIRKVPHLVTVGRRRSAQLSRATQSGSSASSNSENNQSNSSAVVAADSSATSAPPTPLESRDFGATANGANGSRRVAYAASSSKPRKKKEETRYWNEYDHPESGDEGDAYYIYIDPNKEDKWLGQDTAEMLYAKFHSFISKKKNEPADEERPLLRPLTGEDDEEEEPSSSPTDSEADSPIKSSFFPRIKGKRKVINDYGSIDSPSTLGNPDSRARAKLTQLFKPADETTPTPSTSSRLLITSLSLTSSAVLCILIATLAVTGRKKQEGEVDAGILLGVIASLFFALTGLVSVLTAAESIGMVRWAVIAVVFAVVCLTDGVLLGRVLV